MATTKKYNKAYYKKNKEALAAGRKKYYRKHRAEILKKIREQRAKHPVDADTRKRWSTKYYRKHKEAIRKKAREYYRRKAQEKKDAEELLNKRKGNTAVPNLGARKGARKGRPVHKKVGAPRRNPKADVHL